MIYFIECKQLNSIKIGFSKNPQKRINQIQRGMPLCKIDLIKIIDGDKIDEKKLLEKFQHLKISGEWLSRSEELLLFIDKLKAFELDIEDMKSNNFLIEDSKKSKIDFSEKKNNNFISKILLNKPLSLKSYVSFVAAMVIIEAICINIFLQDYFQYLQHIKK